MSFYTYAHVRNDTGKIFYIGKGQGDRAYFSYNRNQYWNRIAKKHGYIVQILSRFDNEEDAFDHEKFLILCFKGMGFKLANLTDGGEGVSNPSPEVRAKISAALAGKKFGEDRIKKMRECRLGIKLSESAKEKISQSLKGRSFNDEHKEKLALGRLGKKHSKQSILKMSQAKVGKKLSEEHAKKISEALSGVKKSLDHIKKVADANRGRPSNRKGTKLSDETRQKMSISRRRVVEQKKLKKLEEK